MCLGSIRNTVLENAGIIKKKKKTECLDLLTIDATVTTQRVDRLNNGLTDFHEMLHAKIFIHRGCAVLTNHKKKNLKEASHYIHIALGTYAFFFLLAISWS